MNQTNLIDLKKLDFVIDNGSRKYYAKSRKIFLNRKAAEALLLAKKYLPAGFNFKIKDGLRTLKEQTKIVKQTEKELKKSHPQNWLKLLKTYTGGYEELKLKKISFMNHRSGLAVDLTLVKNGRELDMGGIKLNQSDALDYYAKKKSLAAREKNICDNRRQLKNALQKAGFKPYLKEWWHWGYQGNVKNGKI